MKKNYLFALITIVIWGAMASILKSIEESIPPVETLFLGAFIASVFMLSVNLLTGKGSLMKAYSGRDYLALTGLGFLGMFVYSASYYYGLSLLTSQEACIINYLWPVMIVIFSCIILKEKFTLKKLLAILCSFLGAVVLIAGNGIDLKGSQAAGVAACLVAAVSYGIFSVLNKRKNYDQGISMMVFWAVTAVCSLITGPMTEDWVMIEAEQIPGLLILGIGADAAAYYLWAMALNGTGNTAKIANLAYLVPLLSVLISAVMLNEGLSLSTVIALLLIVGGILIQLIQFKKKS